MTKNKNNKKIILGTLILIILLIFSFQFLNKNLNLRIETSASENIEKVILKIDQLEYSSPIQEPITVLTLMERMSQEGKINFTTKDYSGMGKFVESINNLKNGKKYWLYYVNGEKAPIGISNYLIQPGDIVEWRYESI